MPLDSRYNVTMFTLAGIYTSIENRYIFFCITLFYYFLIIFVNFTIIITVALRKPLHEPMYIFLCNLCVNGLYGTAGFYPKFLYDLLSDIQVISFSGCFIQVFVLYSSVLCDFSTLTVMAYDRSVAICNPLQYHTIMTHRTVFKLITFAWIAPLSCMSLLVSVSSSLTLCGSQIDKLYCESWAIVKMSCSSNLVYNILSYIVILSYFGHSVFIMFSYMKLIKTCLKSTEQRKKLMQTCTPHLISLINVTVALLFDVMFSRYGSKDFPQALRHFLALEFLIVPPLLNPLIYGLKLKKVRIEVLRYIKINPVQF